MSWFFRPRRASGSATNASRLVLSRAKTHDVEIDLRQAAWLGYVQVGDDLTPVYEGWWLIAVPGGSVAVSDESPMVRGLLCAGELTPAADDVSDKFILFLASRPTELRGRQSADGVAVLDAAATESIKSKGTIEQVERLSDLPDIR